MELEIDRRTGTASVPVHRGKEGAEPKGELLFKLSILVPTLTYGHELWEVTERTRLRVQAAEISVLRRVAGLSLRDMVRSSAIR